MSISRFRQVISQATQDRRLELTEARTLVAAVGTSVSATEARELKDLYGRLTTTRAASAPQVYATSGALAHLGAFFKQVALPVGPNEGAMREQLRRAFEQADLGAPLSRAPSTSSLMELQLRDARPVDGTRQTAFVSPARREVFLRVDGGGRANPGARWFGPFDLDALPSSRVRDLVAGEVNGALFNTIRENLRGELSRGLAFGRSGPPPGSHVRLGDLLADRRGTFTVYVPDRAPLDASTSYAVKRTLEGVETWSTALEVKALPDPATDGRVSPAMRTRARNIWFQLERNETWNMRTSGPPRSTRLVFAELGGSVPTGAFVVGRNADGSLKDPDTSRSVWFRTADGRWSGPHDIKPVVG